MTPDISLTDRTTWIGLLTLVAAVLSDVFHRSFAAYVPAAATVAAGLVVAIILLSKHHLAAALQTAAGAAAQVPENLPPALSARVKNLIDSSAELALLGTHLLTASAPATAPQPAPAVSAQPPAAPVAPAAPQGAAPPA